MIRIGNIVEFDDNPLQIVSPNYKKIVLSLSALDFQDDKNKLLGCLTVSQTQKRYKQYMIYLLHNLEDLPVKKLISAWQNDSFKIKDEDYSFLLSEKENKLLAGRNLEDKLSNHPELFNDGLLMEFYPTMKKGMVYWRRLTKKLLSEYDSFDQIRKLVLHFITAQLLISWESSCIHLGKMILEGYSIENISVRFNAVWPIYTSSKTY